MVNYCNKRFFVIFLSLSLVLPIYGMEKSNGNIFSGIFKTIVNTIKSPFSYLGRMISSTIKKDNCVENDNPKFTTQSVEHQNKLHEKNFSETPKTTRDFFIPLITILYLYTHKQANVQNDFIAKLKVMRTKNENYNIGLKNALNKALVKARKDKENKFSDKDCDEINNCLKQNIDVNFHDNFGRNQLHIMLEMFGKNSGKFDIEIFKNLVKRRVRLDADKDGVTPLKAAMLIGPLEEVNKRVDAYTTVLGLLMDSVGSNGINSRLITERQEAREYFARANAMNNSNNEIFTTLKQARSNKGIIPILN